MKIPELNYKIYKYINKLFFFRKEAKPHQPWLIFLPILYLIDLEFGNFGFFFQEGGKLEYPEKFTVGIFRTEIQDSLRI